MTAPSPFSPRMALALVAGGALLFLALLWMVGRGIGDDGTNNGARNGGGHAAGRGLNGFAALARLAEAEGNSVTLARSPTDLGQSGLLILTPPADANGEDIDILVTAHRAKGPTLVILPKWQVKPVDTNAPGAQKGWVNLAGVQPPNWQGFLDDVSITIRPMPASHGQWRGTAFAGQLPVPKLVLSGNGQSLVPLVLGDEDGRILAAFVHDAGRYPALEALATGPSGDAAEQPETRDTALYPLILTFEPDLLDNFGMARPEQARLAATLIAAAQAGGPRTIIFDLTLNGLARTPNLLTLALTPPYLAATLCLLLAALAVGWRGFARFGAARAEDRDLAFGKTMLVANTAALIRRARRHRLLPAPYVEAARARIAHALGLPRLSGPAALDAAIDRALATRQPSDLPDFSQTATRLLAAHGQTELLRAAQELHALERKLTQ